jgi:uncharacterized membrane protein YhaH (DUF805 family)
MRNNAIIYAILYPIDFIVYAFIGVPFVKLVYLIALFVPITAATSRRLHDTNQRGSQAWAPIIILLFVHTPFAKFSIGFSAWIVFASADDHPLLANSIALFWALMVALTIAVWIRLIVKLSQAGTEGDNQYDAQPILQIQKSHSK